MSQTVTAATGGTGISADRFGGTWTTLSGPVIQETAPGQLQSGNIRFQVPSGFIWDTGGTAPSVSVTQPKGNRITVTLSSRTSTEIIFQLTGNSGGSPPNNPHQLTFSNFRVRPSQGSPLASGQIRNAGSAAPGGTLNYGSISMVAGADNKIRVETASTAAGAVVSAQNVEAGSSITVYSNVRDQFNNFKRNQSSTWSLQSTTGGVSGGDLSASGASATFTGDLVGSARIRANNGGLTATQSGIISVIPSDATTLSIATQPSTPATAGQAFTTQPAIQILDDYSNVVTSDNFTEITVERNSGTGELQGITTVPASSGVATFSGLNHLVANTIDLDFSSPGFTTVTSNSVNVNPAAADSLIFTVQPTNSNKTTAIDPPVVVQIADPYGNSVSQSGTQVTLNIVSGTGIINSGDQVNTVGDGSATFTNVKFNQTGTKTINASATGLDTSEESNSFTIADAGTLAGFNIEISGGGAIGSQTAGVPFDIRIEAVDGAGDVVDGVGPGDPFTGNVDLVTTSQFSSTTDTLTVGPFVSGVYDPHEVQLIEAGNNLTITATNSSGSESGQSDPFTVNPATADPTTSTISISTDTLIADGSSQSVITVQLKDEFLNNLIAGGETVIISRTGTGILSSTTDNSDGTYTATITAPNDVGSADISATVNSSSITTGDPEVVYTFDELSTFLVEATGSGSIGTQTAGSSFDIRITAQDAYSNTVTTFDETVQITSTGSLSSGGGTTTSFISGVLDPHSVTITSTGSVTISARKTASTEIGASNSFIVNPGVANVSTSTIISDESFLQNNGSDQTDIIVQLKDAFGNNLTTGGDAVTLSTTAGTLSDSDGGTAGNQPIDNSDGTYTATLTASASIETATISGTINGSPISDNEVVEITQFNIWDGSGGGNPAGRSDWGNTSKWSLGSLPSTGQVVLIETGQTYYPIIDSEDPVIDFLSIESGATVTLSGRTITINNEITGDGSFSGNNGTINLEGDSDIANFISGSSVVNLNGSSTQTLEGDFTADNLNIQNNVNGNGYLEAFSLISIETGNTLTMGSGSQLVALGDITVDGNLVGNNSEFQFAGDINGSNFTLNNTSLTLNGTTPQEINGIEEIKSFTINNTSGVQVNNDLAVTDTLFLTNGLLTIGSGYSFASNVKEGNTGNIRMLRATSGDTGWQVLSSPLNSNYSDFIDEIITQGFPGAFYATGTEPGDTLQPNVLYYDETDSDSDSLDSQGNPLTATDNDRWRTLTDTSSTITAGRGHYIFFFGDIATDPLYNTPLPDTIAVQGEENSGVSGNLTFPVTYTADGGNGWNLLGNPYSATIDWDDGNWTKTNMDNVIYIWDASSGEYLDWNGIDGTLSDGKIKPFQGFWVKANGNGAPALSVSENSKTTGGTFYKERQEVSIELVLRAADMTKRSHITFSLDGRISKDNLDAIRLLPFERDTYLELFSMLDDGTELSINNMPRDFGIPIEIPIYIGGYKNGNALNGPAELTWNGVKNLPESWKLTLVDNTKKKNQQKAELDLHKTDYIKRTLNQTDSLRSKITFSNFKLTNASSTQNLQKAQFLLRIDPGEDANGLPDSYKLERNYPNPFNPSTTLEFSTPLEGPVSLEVYDILGRKVSTLVDDNFQAGFHKVTWNASQFSSGVYFAILRADGNEFTQKLTLIK